MKYGKRVEKVQYSAKEGFNFCTGFRGRNYLGNTVLDDKILKTSLTTSKDERARLSIHGEVSQ